MIRKQTVRLAAVVLALVLLPLARTSPALAAAPSNDDFANATAITSLPYSDSTSAVEATKVGDPVNSCSGNDDNTLWYSFTPSADGYADVNTFGSDYDTTLAAYTESAGTFTEVVCNDDAGSYQSQVLVPLTGGTTYYFMVGAYYANMEGGVGNLVFNVSEVVYTVTLTNNVTGSVSGKTGAATVSGSFSCSYPGTVDVEGTLTQVTRKGETITGSFQLADLTCDGAGSTTNWTATVVPTSGKFARGDASLSTTADGTGAGTAADSDAQATTVTLGRR